MMECLKSAVIAAVLVVSVASIAPAFAQPDDRNPNSPGLGWGPPSTRGAPGPLAAVGLPFLIAAGAVGAYKLVRRRQAARDQPAQD